MTDKDKRHPSGLDIDPKTGLERSKAPISAAMRRGKAEAAAIRKAVAGLERSREADARRHRR